MIKKVLALAVAAVTGLSAYGQSAQKEIDRVKDAGHVLSEIMNIPDNIPQSVIDKAYCVVVLPSVLKAAFIVGGSYGRGVMTCRGGANLDGRWGTPTMMALEGGSFGLQIGGQATDFVLLLMTSRSAHAILNSKVKLGVDASAAAGPVGRNAQAATDITMRAEILSYSRARGLFAGISLEGSTLRADNEANKRLYGKDVTAQQIVFEHAVAPPPAASQLLAVLDKRSPKRSK
ncbi:MAG TPA: lipid-binding SYLF domain-containing protein [Acidobacteriaceae bacterium]